MTYRVTLSGQARRALTDALPTPLAAACFEFISNPLADNSAGVGKPLRPPLEGSYAARRGEYRVIYRIAEGPGVVEVLSIRHRRDAYR